VRLIDAPDEEGGHMPDVQPGAVSTPVPEYRGYWLVGCLPQFQRPLHFFRELGQRGSVVRFRLGWEDCYLLTSPEGIEQVLTDQDFTRDTPAFHMLRKALGEGLITTDGQDHLRRRRLIQPAFQRKSFQRWDSVIQQAINDMLSGWQPAQVVDVASAMIDLTFRILGEILFSLDLQRSDLQEAFAAIEAYVNQSRFFSPPLFAPTSLNRRFKRARTTLERIIMRFVEEHQQQPERFEGDVLSFLLQTRGVSERGLSPNEVLFEIEELIPAGHETTASALMWVWYLLALHPEVEARLHAEICAVLADRRPAIDDLPRLPYGKWILQEALRLYPAIFTVSRRASRDAEVCGYHIPHGALLFLSPWVTQRDPAYWQDPQAFRPERFASQDGTNWPRGAYFPFGGGGHRCLGEHLAMIEGQLILATIAQRYRLSLVEGHVIRPGLFPALRPRYGLPMALHAWPDARP
jgi:cytochrome P450